jgi:biopolymer transport protein ExbD
MRLQSKRLEDPELNLTSLIDVVLLLVIFFMISTTFVQEGRLRIELPEAGTATVDRQRQPIVITVHRNSAAPSTLLREPENSVRV